MNTHPSLLPAFGGTILFVHFGNDQPRSDLGERSADDILCRVKIMHGARVLQTGCASQLFDIGAEGGRCRSFARTRRQVRAIIEDKYQQIFRLIPGHR